LLTFSLTKKNFSIILAEVGMKKLLLLIILFISSGISLNAATLFRVVDGDTAIDPNHWMDQDLRRVEKEATVLAHALSLDYQVVTLEGTHLSKQNVLQTIDTLPMTAENLVLFYCTGHGFRTENKKSVWPYLLLMQAEQTIDLDPIIHLIQARQPRFALVIANCYNNPFSDGYRLPPGRMVSFHPERTRCGEALSPLVSQSEGVVVISGAIVGEYSLGTSEGGILTNALFDAAQETPHHWCEWMEAIVQRKARIQHPQMQIYP